MLIGPGGSAAAYRLRVAEFESRQEAEPQRRRSDELLPNVLPPPVAEELKSNGRVTPRGIDAATIVFTDFVGFTARSAAAEPRALVASLDEAFSQFDGIVDRYRLEKLKTIGDAYMFAAGVLGDGEDHVLRCLLAAMEMVALARLGGGQHGIVARIAKQDQSRHGVALCHDDAIAPRHDRTSARHAEPRQPA